MTGARRKGGKHRLTIETRGDTEVLICAHCPRPYASVENGEVRILSRHGSEQDENILTEDQWRIIGGIIYRQKHPPERW